MKVWVLVLGVVVEDVVAVSAVLRMHDSRATTFGSRCFNKSVIFGIQICFWLQGPLLQLSHARSAFRSDWWINCGFWRSGLCRRFSEGLKTALGTDYGSFTTTAHWMTIKPWSKIRSWPFKLCSLSSWSFSCPTGSRIRAWWWHVSKMMTSFLSSIWTSHEIPILKMQMQWRPCVRHPLTEVSNAYLYW